jgi:hypothetical protein
VQLIANHAFWALFACLYLEIGLRSFITPSLTAKFNAAPPPSRYITLLIITPVWGPLLMACVAFMIYKGFRPKA